MRELNQEEIQRVNGGNPAYAALQLVSAFQSGYQLGSAIAKSINGSFSMTTGEAAYYTFNK